MCYCFHLSARRLDWIIFDLKPIVLLFYPEELRHCLQSNLVFDNRDLSPALVNDSSSAWVTWRVETGHKCVLIAG